MILVYFDLFNFGKSPCGDISEQPNGWTKRQKIHMSCIQYVDVDLLVENILFTMNLTLQEYSIIEYLILQISIH